MVADDSVRLEKAFAEIENKNYATALVLLTPLVEAGNLHATCNLAALYQCGWGVNANGPLAVELYLKVARSHIKEKGLSGIAYHNLATIYATGLPGVERDIEKAREYHRLAEILGVDSEWWHEAKP